MSQWSPNKYSSMTGLSQIRLKFVIYKWFVDPRPLINSNRWVFSSQALWMSCLWVWWCAVSVWRSTVHGLPSCSREESKSSPPGAHLCSFFAEFRCLTSLSFPELSFLCVYTLGSLKWDICPPEHYTSQAREGAVLSPLRRRVRAISAHLHFLLGASNPFETISSRCYIQFGPFI